MAEIANPNMLRPQIRRIFQVWDGARSRIWTLGVLEKGDLAPSEDGQAGEKIESGPEKISRGDEISWIDDAGRMTKWKITKQIFR